MKVRMLINVSGVHDGQHWPKIGDVAEVSGETGADLCKAGLAEPVAEPAKPEKATTARKAEKRG